MGARKDVTVVETNNIDMLHLQEEIGKRNRLSNIEHSPPPLPPPPSTLPLLLSCDGTCPTRNIRLNDRDDFFFLFSGMGACLSVSDGIKRRPHFLVAREIIIPAVGCN